MTDKTAHLQGEEDGIEPIAIVGMSLRVPGAKQLETFWQNLRDGVESITFFDDETLLAAGVSAAELQDPNYVKAFGWLEDIDKFDAEFFDLSAREAEILDPQHRLFLECAWEVLEHGGYDPETYDGRIGVFTGAGMNHYLLKNVLPNPQVIESIGGWSVVMSNDKDFIPTRASYKLNLIGPSACISTGCSASLVSIAMAAQSLLSYQSDMMIAGGITVQETQPSGYLYQRGSIASSDGHCRPFDADAEGTLDANGVGLVLLKRLSDAEADGDTIHAVIKGFAVNNDGSFKVGYTAPSIEGQTAVVEEALDMAGISAETISYVEAHGTGTNLGDPIELTALTHAFRNSTQRKQYCAVGSVKSNLGHLDTAAGVAGLIKTVLAMKHQQIPPTLHYQKPNPKIDFANSPFYVNAQLQAWPSNGQPRRAGVSSLGIGGTNAHVVLEEAPRPAPSSESRPWQVLCLSAKTEAALEQATANLIQHLTAHPEQRLADIAYTLSVGRHAFKHRRIVVCQSHADAVQALQNKNPQRVFTSTAADEGREVAFMFPGMGSEYLHMASELYQQEPLFREEVDYCADILRGQGFDLFKVMGHTRAKQLQGMPYTHAPVALFVVAYSLARFWQQCGIEPQAMLGYSGGEYTAACLNGVCSLEAMLSIMVVSGQAMEALSEGALLAVAAPQATVQPLVDADKRLGLAAINGPLQCVVAGAVDAIAQLEQQLAAQAIPCNRVPGSRAFHSALAEPMVASLMQAFSHTPLKAPQQPWVSGVTGTWISNSEATDPKYYAASIGLQPVRFADSIQRLFERSNLLLLEVGPGQVLSPLVLQHPNYSRQQLVLSSQMDPRYGQSEHAALLTALGKAWLAGAPVDWRGFFVPEQRRRLPLPTYPFQHQRYWVDAKPFMPAVAAAPVENQKNPNIGEWFYVPTWQRSPVKASTVAAEKEACWLVFTDADGIGDAVVQGLQQQGQRVITVTAAQQFSHAGPYSYSINPTQAADYERLLQAVQAQNYAPTHLLHTWLISASAASALNHGFYSVLWLAQALAKVFISEPMQLTVVSSELQEVLGTEPLCPEKAAVLGPLKVIPQEYSHLRCVSVDVERPNNANARAQLVSQLLQELQQQGTCRTVALRGAFRWQQAFEQTVLPLATEGAPFKQNGVYLITGGLGNIGLLVSDLLAQQVQAKLVLVSRAPLPAASEWDSYLQQHADTDAVSQKLRRLKALQAAGAEVLTLAADVSDVDAMRKVVADTKQRFGRLDGVLHAAGIVGDQSIRVIAETDAAYCEQHFKGKLHGVQTLAQVLAGESIDFILLFSSLSSMLGGLGFAAYAAGNTILDSFSQQQQRLGHTRWLSVNWDGWSFAAHDDAPKAGASLEALAMLPAEGVQALQSVLAQPPYAQVVVSTGDLMARVRQWVDTEAAAEVEALPEVTEAKNNRPQLMTEYVAPRDELEAEVAALWQRLLGIDPIGIYDNFFELGGNSLLMTQLVTHIRKAFHVEVSLTHLFDAPFISDTSEQINALRWSQQPATTADDDEDREEGEL